MIVLKCKAPKANGLSSNEWFYVANEYREPDGRPFVTLTKELCHAKKYFTDELADASNARLMAAGSISQPFQKMKL